MFRKHISVRDRNFVIERAKARCEYCLSPMQYSTQSFDVDHIIPISRGGDSSTDNMAHACSGCNRQKFNHMTGYDPVEAKEVPLFHPRQDRWLDHFQWNEDFRFVIGITSTGRATVEALQLNRAGVVNLRRLLKLAGEHPPQVQV